jgi:hypothetical protein
MPEYEFPDVQTLVRYLAMLREVIVHARFRAYETDPEIARLVDEVENVPDLLGRWPDMREDFVIAGLRAFERKYLAGQDRFSKILIDGPAKNWQLRWNLPPDEPASTEDLAVERRIIGGEGTDQPPGPPSLEQVRSDYAWYRESVVWRISCELSYWSDSVATFDPEKVATRLLKAFPEAIIDPQDRSEAEVQRIRAFLEERYPSNEPSQTKDTVLRQIQGKQRRNGPEYGFQLPAGPTRIRGLIARYRIDFSSDAALDQSLQDRIASFLNSLNLGSIKVSRKIVPPARRR